MPRKLTNKAIATNTIKLSNCDWYSPGILTDTGGLKLPVGATSERPTVVQGGREVVTFNLTTSQPDLAVGDPGFDMMDPWIWSWESNYNRANAQTSLTVTAGQTVSGLTLLRGSTYIFKNYTVGHMLWLKSQALSEAEYNAGQTNLYKLGTSDGVTNNGAKRTVGSTDPGIITWTIPLDYPHNQVVIQHGQYGMDNTVTVSNPPAGTIGYLRLNSDVGHDPTTKTGVEVYTGTGWKTLPFEDNVQAVKAHPTDSLTLEDNGTLTDAVTTTTDGGALTDTPIADDLGALQLLAYLASGKLSINNNAIVVHDGSTPGGFPMLRDNQANLSDSLVNKRFTMLRCNSQTTTGTSTSGSLTSRVSFDNSIEAGISGITLSDSYKKITFTKDTTAFYKIDFKFKPSAACTIELWKNGSKVTYADYDSIPNYHNHFTWMESFTFNDYLEVRTKTSDNSSININTTDILLIEFVGS